MVACFREREQCRYTCTTSFTNGHANARWEPRTCMSPSRELRRYPELTREKLSAKRRTERLREVGTEQRITDEQAVPSTVCRVNVDAAESRRRTEIYTRVIFSLYRIYTYVYRVKSRTRFRASRLGLLTRHPKSIKCVN